MQTIGKRIEYWHPVAFGLLTGLSLFVYSELIVSEHIFHSMSVLLMMFYLMAIIFLYLCLELMYVHEKDTFVQGMKQSGAFALLIEYHYQGLIFCIIGSILASLHNIDNAHKLLENALIAISVCAFFAVVRSARLMKKLIQYTQEIH